MNSGLGVPNESKSVIQLAGVSILDYSEQLILAITDHIFYIMSSFFHNNDTYHSPNRDHIRAKLWMNVEQM